MPTSDSDPLATALSSTFKTASNNHGASAVAAKMETSLRRSMLVPVQFDDPIVHTKSSVKSNYIVLASSAPPSAQKMANGGGVQNGAGAGNSSPAAIAAASPKQGRAKTLDQVPAPKLVMFQKDQIQVGYNKMTGAGAGMYNMGNTCYLNSTLQALLHIPAFVNYLSSGCHEKECSISGFSSCTICIMYSTLRQTHQSNVIKPSKIYEKLKFICKHLMHGRQEDAHEFLRYLIESMQRCYLISKKVPKTLDSYSKETTPFNQIFGGYLRQELHCLKCRHVSITFQHFMDLMLDIKNADNIDAALIGYFKRETLSQEDMYKCEKCKQKVPAHKIYRIERPPMVLCIQLKRFNIMGGKNGRPVTLARNLDITRFIRWANDSGLSFTYNLTSLITHVGPSPNCGHYTAIGQAPNGTYYRFDDSSVNPTSVQNVLNTSAYVIFYEMTRASRDRYLAAMASSSNQTANSVYKSAEKLIGPQLPQNAATPLKVVGNNKPTPSTSNFGLVKPRNASSPSLNGNQSSSSNSPNLISAKKPPVPAPAPNVSPANTATNMPRLISDPATPNTSKSLDKERSKLGVLVANKPNNSLSKSPSGGQIQKSLVADYGDEDDTSSSDEEKESSAKSKENVVPGKGDDSSKGVVTNGNQLSASKNPIALGQTPPNAKPLFPGLKTQFLPRAVAANLKKNLVTDIARPPAPNSSLSTTTNKSEEVGIYDEHDLKDKGNVDRKELVSSSAMTSLPLVNETNNTDNGTHHHDIMRPKSSCSQHQQDRHGFTVMDKESHNPSIHSDNSSGSAVSFSVTDLRPGSAGTGSSTSSNGSGGAAAKQNWNITSVHNKRERPCDDGDDKEGGRNSEGGSAADDVCSSPLKRSKLKEESSTLSLSSNEKAKKSVLEDVKTKTTETWREFSKDVMSAGAKLKQQFEIRSNKVTDKLENLSKNIEDIMPKFEDQQPSTSCEASTSQGSCKPRCGEEDLGTSDSPKKKNKKKKKKKKKNGDRERSRSRSVEKLKEKSKDRSRSRSSERSQNRLDRNTNNENIEKKSSYTKDDNTSISDAANVRHTSWDRDAPVKRWDSKPKNGGSGGKSLDRSATWDGSKGTNFLDEIKRSSTIRSWSGGGGVGAADSEANGRERKRSMSPATDEDEMDRGRVKKVKKKKEERKMSYNPFQVVQNIRDRGGPSYLMDKYNNRHRSSSGFRDGRGGGGENNHHRSKDRHHGGRDKYNRGGGDDYNRSQGGGRGSSSDYRRDHHYNNHSNNRHNSSWDHNYHRN